MSSIQSCIQDIKTWLTDNFLLLNDKKRKLLNLENSTPKKISNSAVQTSILSLVLPALDAHWT